VYDFSDVFPSGLCCVKLSGKERPYFLSSVCLNSFAGSLFDWLYNTHTAE